MLYDFNVSIDYLVFGDQALEAQPDDAIVVTDQNERILITHYRALHYLNQIKVLSSVIEESEKEQKAQ